MTDRRASTSSDGPTQRTRAAHIAACTAVDLPSWKECYDLGRELNRILEPTGSLADIATELGISRQNAYTETVHALGKLAWLLCGDLKKLPSLMEQTASQRRRRARLLRIDGGG